ncbi:regulator of Vps4 activity in the MVB pathway-domain-containing protein [Mycena sanguinolenta]|nr:regulator of Vps4 activity in the MVB pathway-domain-containing protein [Mycena sanguinolenta]
MPPWNAPKAKVQLRLSVQRLRTLQQKKEAQAKASRRDVVTLLERGKTETARIKVETIINEDIHIELLELLELYSELLLARFGLLDQKSAITNVPSDVNPNLPPAHGNQIQASQKAFVPNLARGALRIIHAAPRTELKELQILRDILMHKYGREFSVAVMENSNGCVSERVRLRKLVNATPSPELVDAYLHEIAKAYGVNWVAPLPAYSADATGEPTVDPSAAVGEEGKEPESTSNSDDPATTLMLPAMPPVEGDRKEKKATEDSKQPKSALKKASPPPDEPEDDFDALTKRFAALKKR